MGQVSCRRFVRNAAGCLSLLIAAGCGGGATATTGGAVAPSGSSVASSDPVVKAISALWAERQDDMMANDYQAFPAVESGRVLVHDQTAGIMIACNCEPPRKPSPLADVVVLRSAGGSPDMVFAEVDTRPPGEAPTRFMVVVERRGGAWKFVFVTYDEDTQAGKGVIANPSVAAPATTAADRRAGLAVFNRLASESQRWMTTGRPMSNVFIPTSEIAKRLVPGRPGANREKTSYGADAVSSLVVRPHDGLYVFRLDARRVITCGTLHTPVRYTLPGGKLGQDAAQQNWGPFLAPGSYRSITMDNQAMTCILDHGRSSSPRYEIMGNYHAMDAVTGTT